MDAALQKIWQALTSLKQADDQRAAMCHTIINLMIRQGVVTKEEATRQIQKSVAKIVALHKEIAETMQDRNSAAGANARLKTLH
jgi:hypothetical protein